jgi:ATP-binding cassette subfamily A (ABC1) protein 1
VFYNSYKYLLNGKVLYYPSTAQTDAIIANANETFLAIDELTEQLNNAPPTKLVQKFLGKLLGCLELDKFQGFANETELIEKEAELSCQANGTECEPSLWATITFADENGEDLKPGTTAEHIIYTIRMSRDVVPSTRSVTPTYWAPNSNNGAGKMRYFDSGFIYLQNMIDDGIIRQQDPNVQTDGIYMQMFPYPCYTPDAFLDAVSGATPLLLTLSWVFTVAIMTKNIVVEKETRQKELMKIMGLSGGSLWAAWFIDIFTLILISSSSLTLMMKFGGIYQYSDGFIIFLYIFSFGCSSIGIIFLLSTFFSTASISAAVAGIVFFLLYLPYNIVSIFRYQMTTAQQLWSCLCPTIALGYGSWQFGDFEKQGTGVTFDNWNIQLQTTDNWGATANVMSCILFMFADGVIYFIIAWYIDNVFPGKYGIPRPFYFFLQPSFWTGKSKRTGDDNFEDLSKVKQEEVSEKLLAGVEIQDLGKTYSSGMFCTKKEKVAVDGLSLNFYESQITSFLGHNGAGKTTTMSMLTGLYPPTSGTAKIMKHDIHDEMDQIRTIIGFCPQHNVLWDDLTCTEHVYFFSKLKGYPDDQIDSEIANLLKRTGLTIKAQNLVPSLSGGMKRKLSVALAFCGGSKVVLLDEPTAGVDPYARRGIWDLLLSYKKGKTVILSTHHMDEAEILGDRIAVISDGQLQCVGSSLWMKRTFGKGYLISVNTSDNKTITDIVSKIASDVTVESTKPNEVSIRIPYDAKEGTMEAIMQELEQSELEGMKNYGVRDTNLDEIFLALNENDEEVSENKYKEDRKMSDDSSCFSNKVSPDSQEETIPDNRVTGFALSVQQFGAIFRKRLINTSRSLISFVTSTFLPPLFVCLALAVTEVIPELNTLEPLNLQYMIFENSSQARFDNVYTFVSQDDNYDADLYDAMTESPSYGTWCMDTKSRNEQREFTVATDSPALSGRYCQDENLAVNWINWKAGERDSNLTAVELGDPSLLNPDCECTEGDFVEPLMNCGDYPEDYEVVEYRGKKKYAGGSPIPIRTDYTGVQVLDLTGRNISDWLAKTVDKNSYNLRRYGGFSFGASARNETEMYKNILEIDAALATRLAKPDNNKIWFNNFGQHGSVSFLNVLSNGLYRKKNTGSKLGIETVSFPTDFSVSNIDQAAIRNSSNDTLVAICVIFAFSFVPASFLVFLIDEKQSGTKYLQFLAGMKPTIYWLANFLWDMLTYSLPVILSLLIFLCFGNKAYVGADMVGSTILIFMLFGLSVTPLMYPFRNWL